MHLWNQRTVKLRDARISHALKLGHAWGHLAQQSVYIDVHAAAAK